MALFTEAAVKANLRNRDGRRVFYLGREDRLTPGARDYLRRNHIEILPAGQAKPQRYQLLSGGEIQDKPEHMTHLDAQTLVPKNHPRIIFRGQVDCLEAELLLAQRQAHTEGYGAIVRELGDALEFSRQALRHDVLNEPMAAFPLGGLPEAELRARSHTPQKYYGQPHFMPDYTQCWTLLAVNRARTTARQAELACYEAFRDREGRCSRPDLLQGFNRLSSFLWILEIRLASGKEKG